MKSVTITAHDLVMRAKHVPAKVQVRFERAYEAARHDEDSAAGDREIRQMVAETFVSVNKLNA